MFKKILTSLKYKLAPPPPLYIYQTEKIFQSLKSYIEKLGSYENLGIKAQATLHFTENIPVLMIRLEEIDIYKGKNRGLKESFHQHTPTLYIKLYQESFIEVRWVAGTYITRNLAQSEGETPIAFKKLFETALKAEISRNNPIQFIRAVSFFNLIVARQLTQLMYQVNNK